MKKIIEGKMYDTDTAKSIAMYEAPCGRGDYGYYEEALYLKKTGEHFLHGVGYAASRYAQLAPGQINTWGSGEKIIPLTEEAAREWAETHLHPDEYAKIFDVVEENCIVTSFSLPDVIHEKFKNYAKDRGVSMRDMLIEYIKSL